VVAFGDLNLWYFGDAARRQQPQVSPQERIADFGEVLGGLSEDEATYEARRRLSCGNCCEKLTGEPGPPRWGSCFRCR
jgi:formate dehydrogenase beta subunit